MAVVRTSFKCDICQEVNLIRIQVGIDGFHYYAFPCRNCQAEIKVDFYVKAENLEAYPKNVNGATVCSGAIGPIDGGRFLCSTHLVPKAGGMFSPFITNMSSGGSPEVYKFIGRAREITRYTDDYTKLDSFLMRGDWMRFSDCARIVVGGDCDPAAPDCIFYFMRLCNLRAVAFCNNGDARWNSLWTYILARKHHYKHSDDLVAYYAAESRLERIWKQLHDVRKNWRTIFELVSPVYFTYFWNKDWQDMTLCQKRFSELKSFYIECYEVLCRIAVIAGVFESLDSGTGCAVPKTNGTLTIFDFDRMDNGQKKDLIEKWKCASRFTSCSDSRLRNAVGHHDAIYNIKDDAIECRNVNSRGVVSDFSISYIEFCRKVCDIYQEVEVAALYVFALRLRSLR